MLAFLEAFTVFGLFLTTHFALGPGEQVLARQALIAATVDDTSITEWRYRGDGMSMVGYPANESGAGTRSVDFSADSRHLLQEYRSRKAAAGPDGDAYDLRFKFGYSGDTLPVHVDFLSDDSLIREFEYRWDPSGRLASFSQYSWSGSVRGPERRATLEYDGSGKLIAIRSGGEKTGFRYGPDGRVAGKSLIDTLTGRIVEEYKYLRDAEGRLSRVEQYGGGSLISVQTFEYALFQDVLALQKIPRRKGFARAPGNPSPRDFLGRRRSGPAAFRPASR